MAGRAAAVAREHAERGERSVVRRDECACVALTGMCVRRVLHVYARRAGRVRARACAARAPTVAASLDARRHLQRFVLACCCRRTPALRELRPLLGATRQRTAGACARVCARGYRSSTSHGAMHCTLTASGGCSRDDLHAIGVCLERDLDASDDQPSAVETRASGTSAHGGAGYCRAVVLAQRLLTHVCRVVRGVPTL